MHQGARLKKIVQYLEENHELLVPEAVRLYKASPATIRRDFNRLVEEGLSLKIRGGVGANPAAAPGELMLPVNIRKTLFAVEKRMIAERAAALIADGDVVIIDGGTTTFFMTRFLANRPVKVITNSVLIAHQIDQERSQKQGAEVFLTGGFLYPEAGILVGPQAIANIAEYHARWAFLSVSGIESSGATNSNQLIVETERAIIQRSEKVVMLADHSKFGKKSMCKLCGWNEIDVLITDRHPDGRAMIRELRSAHGVEIIEAG